MREPLDESPWLRSHHGYVTPAVRGLFDVVLVGSLLIGDHEEPTVCDKYMSAILCDRERRA